MRAAVVFAGVALVLALALGASVEDRHFLLLETAPPAGWELLGAPSPQQTVPFFIALKQQNLDRLEAVFWSVSDPTNVHYGEYLTRDQVLAIVAPAKETVQRVLDILPEGISCEDLGDALRCIGTVRAIEQVFQTRLVVVRHSDSGLSLIRQIGNFSIPAAVAGDVEFVSPLSQYISPSLNVKKSRNAADLTIVPETLFRLYNITEKGDARSTQGVAEFDEENWKYLDSDLQQFASLTNTVISFTQSFGPDVKPGDPLSIEATLDVQYVGAIGQGNTNWYWKEQVWMFDFTQNLQNQTNRPNILSLSYAWSEEQQCASLTDQQVCTRLKLSNQEYVARINTEFQKIGAQGITIVVASGDSGCHGRTDEDCALKPGKRMYPDYPAASPFVTSVGGTVLVNAKSNNPTEPICKNHGVTCATDGNEVTATTEKQLAEIVSGGGFSNFATRPAYQDTVVQTYLTSAKAQLPPSDLWQPSNRGFPDVSALSHNYYIQANGQIAAVDGTSCAAPVWAGIIGLINAHRLRLGRPVVGFANPLLYQVYNATRGAAFQDITVGNNRCTEEGCACTYGFPAVAGWDAATGLGTPNVGLIIQAIDALDAQREALKRRV